MNLFKIDSKLFVYNLWYFFRDANYRMAISLFINTKKYFLLNNQRGMQAKINVVHFKRMRKTVKEINLVYVREWISICMGNFPERRLHIVFGRPFSFLVCNFFHIENRLTFLSMYFHTSENQCLVFRINKEPKIFITF